MQIYNFFKTKGVFFKVNEILGEIIGVFWLNIAKFEIYLRYRYCFNLFREMRKESECRQHRCRNSTKV